MNFKTSKKRLVIAGLVWPLVLAATVALCLLQMQTNFIPVLFKYYTYKTPPAAIQAYEADVPTVPVTAQQLARQMGWQLPVEKDDGLGAIYELPSRTLVMVRKSDDRVVAVESGNQQEAVRLAKLLNGKIYPDVAGWSVEPTAKIEHDTCERKMSCDPM